MDRVRYATTRSHAALDADDADVRATRDVAGRLISAHGAPKGASMRRPFAADGARLRRVVLFDLDAGRELVVEQNVLRFQLIDLRILYGSITTGEPSRWLVLASSGPLAMAGLTVLAIARQGRGMRSRSKRQLTEHEFVHQHLRMNRDPGNYRA